MTIHRYLLEYWLENLFQGNQTAFAGALGMEYNEFHKFRKRMENGSFSIRTADALFQFCWREKVDMNIFFENYSASNLGEAIEERENLCEEWFCALRSVIQAETRHSNNMAELMRAACDFEDKIKRCVCDEAVCRYHANNEEGCPIQDFRRLINDLSAKYTAREAVPSP